LIEKENEAMAGITDIVATVTVPKPEYETLIRGSEQIDIIKSLLAKNEYVSTGDLRVILNVEKPEEGKEENNGN
jgi:hypothetical protein